MAPHKRYRIFLAALAVAGSFLIYIATSHYGPGLSTDGARYLSTAESIARGDGIIDYLGLPLINWPPLYPIILAALHLITRLDVFVLAQWLNIFAFGFIIWLGGLFFQRSLPGNYAFAVLATLTLAVFLPIVEVSANVASDPLFIVYVLLFLLAAQNYLATRARSHWWQMVLIAITGCFLRYAGLALVISGGFVVLLAWRKNWRKAIVEAALFGLAAGAPIAAWALFHNLPLGGTILGAHRPSNALGNFNSAVEKVVSWFVPESILAFIPPLLLLAAVLALWLLRSNRARWADWRQRIFQPQVLPSAVFFAVYSAVLIFGISYSEHRVPGSQRIHALLLPSLLVLGILTLQVFFSTLSRKWRAILLAVFALWLLFPLYRTAVYVQASKINGDVSYYNLYNTAAIRESDIVAELRQRDFEPNERVYANNEAAAWFYLRRQIYRLPRYDAELGDDLGEVITTFPGWPPADQTATLIWFERELDYKDLVPIPEQMQNYISLDIIFSGRYGDIYLLDVE
jgi:hypothetical protein